MRQDVKKAIGWIGRGHERLKDRLRFVIALLGQPKVTFTQQPVECVGT